MNLTNGDKEETNDKKMKHLPVKNCKNREPKKKKEMNVKNCDKKKKQNGEKK
jgi:hypothetical protein